MEHFKFLVYALYAYPVAISIFCEMFYYVGFERITADALLGTAGAVAIAITIHATILCLSLRSLLGEGKHRVVC